MLMLMLHSSLADWLQDGVVLVWITNRERLHRCVATELLPAWGLVHTATWVSE